MNFRNIFKSVFILGSVSLALTGCAMKGGSAGDGVNAEYGSSDTNGTGIGLGTLQRIYFDFDKSNISPEAAKVLKSNAEAMQKDRAMKVLVEGHTDDRGTNEYNIALGERRAKMTLDYLVSLGVARNRLEMKSWGEEKPLDTDKTEEAFARNRRAEFVILSK
ncbi:MAG: peptidoglycan-associated lipoprotein Pal [Deltaproteobacteria bacterium]|nr:peptidoglycan-associated lipoprotein Pal [Deltaproteobacteria bacterium]